jgi:hypothetical protein
MNELVQLEREKLALSRGDKGKALDSDQIRFRPMRSADYAVTSDEADETEAAAAESF